MNPTIHTACRLFLFTGTLAAPAFAQEKPVVVEVSKPSAPALAVSSQGKEKAAVDISVSLRHATADAKCANEAACSTTGHWLVNVDVAGRKADGKPVALTMSQLAEIEKELTAAAAPKAKKAGEATISEATLSIRTPLHTPYGLVQQLVATAAKAGIHRIEFAVASAAAAEQSLPVPIPVDTGTVLVDMEGGKPKAVLQEIRVVVLMDQATGQPVRRFGMNIVPNGAEGDAKLADYVKAAAKDLAGLGIGNAPVVIDAAESVPWQAIVGVVDAVRSAGVKDVHFAAPAAKK